MSDIKTFEPLSDEDLLANQELNQRIGEGMIQKNIEQIMSCIWDSPDFVFVATDGTVFLGSENFRKATKAWFAAFESIDVVEEEARFIPAGDSLLVVGKATYTLTAKDGSSHKLPEVWTDVRKKIGGRWVMVLDHAHALNTPE